MLSSSSSCPPLPSSSAAPAKKRKSRSTDHALVEQSEITTTPRGWIITRHKQTPSVISIANPGHYMSLLFDLTVKTTAVAAFNKGP